MTKKIEKTLCICYLKISGGAAFLQETSKENSKNFGVPIRNILGMHPPFKVLSYDIKLPPF